MKKKKEINLRRVETRIRSVLKAHFTRRLKEGVNLDDTILSLDAIDNIIQDETGRGSESDFVEMDAIEAEEGQD